MKKRQLSLWLDASVLPVSLFDLGIARGQLKRIAIKALTTVEQAQQAAFPKITLDVRFVTPEESQTLNTSYRNKAKPTNILSFPHHNPLLNSVADTELFAESTIDFVTTNQQHVGDLAICFDVLQAEALAQGKTIQQHLSHLLVHGMLHLLGYDHENSPADAAQMECLEVDILSNFNISTPYE